MDRALRIARLWDYLPAFRLAAESGQISHAARSLGVSPSAVSRTVGLLEAELGREVFDRNGRRITLNPAGEELLSAIRTAMRTVDEALLVLAGTQLVGSVTIGTVEPLTSLYVVPALSVLSARHSGLETCLRPADAASVVAELLRGDLDVAFVHELVERRHVSVERLGEIKLGVFSASPTKPGPRLTPEPYVALSTDARGAARDNWPLEHERVVKVRVANFGTALDVCRSGDYRAVLPVALAEAAGLCAVAQPRIKPLAVYAVWREQLPTRGRAEAVIEAVRCAKG